jgi:hypothetical protein
VTLVHSETSTGVLHDVAAFAAALRRVAPDALLLVDAVTSLAAAELRPRAWGLDAVVAGSQKGVMLPPGLGFAWLSERAWARAPDPGGGCRPTRSTCTASGRQQREGDSGVHAADVADRGRRGGLGRCAAGLEARWRDLERRNRAVLAAGARWARRRSPSAQPGGRGAADARRASTPSASCKALARRGVRIAGGQDRLKGSCCGRACWGTSTTTTRWCSPPRWRTPGATSANPVPRRGGRRRPAVRRATGAIAAARGGGLNGAAAARSARQPRATNGPATWRRR